MLQRMGIKRRWAKMTMASKITVLYGGLFAVIFLAVSAFMMLNANLFYRDLSKKELNQTADRVTEYILSGQPVTKEAFQSINPNKHIMIRVFDLSLRKEMVVDADSFPFPLMSAAVKEIGQEPFEQDHSGQNQFGQEQMKFSDARRIPRHMFGERVVEYGGKTYVVQVYREYAREHQFLRLFAILFFVVKILGLGAAFFIGRYISRQMVKPIELISRTAERISIEDLSRRIDVGESTGELRRLAVTFNDMIDRLESAFIKQNQFVSDASHELRTPISVIQGYASLIDRWGKSDPEILQESIDSINAETARMATMVKKLLFLARGDQEKIGLNKEAVSLNQVAAEVVKEAEMMENEVFVKLLSETEETVRGDYGLIKQMLWIFVENSIKYAGEKGGSITIKVSEKDGRSCLAVADNGVGIDEADLPHIFERFYRGDKSRSNEVPGTGLGLSVADWIMNRHDARAEVKSRLGEGTEVFVYFDKLSVL